MNRVLAIVHPDCEHAVCVATDGVDKALRPRARRLLDALHAAGYARLRLRAVDGKPAKLSIVAANLDGCATCRITPAEGDSPEVHRAATAQAERSGKPTEDTDV